MDWSSICFKVSSMQASVDDDDQLLDRPLDCPEYALLYDTGFLFGFLYGLVVNMFKGIVHASFS